MAMSATYNYLSAVPLYVDPEKQLLRWRSIRGWIDIWNVS